MQTKGIKKFEMFSQTVTGQQGLILGIVLVPD